LADAVAELDDALCWRTSAFSARIARRSIEIMANDLPAVVELVGRELGVPDRAASVLAALKELPTQSAMRILVAPETSRRVYMARKHPSHAFLSIVESWCLAERLRIGHATDPSETVWTALGDTCWTPGESPRVQEAFLVAGRIVADFDSPWRYRTAPSVADQLEDWTEGPPLELDERSRLTSALERSLQRIAGVSLDAASLILDITRSIVLVSRTDPNRPFSSQSQRTVPGRILLAFHSPLAFGEENPAFELARLADALLHEAIHSAIYWWEIDEPLFVREGLFAQVCLRSPWTGRLLPAQTFVHACFVWAGLRRFWSRAAAGVMFGEPVSEHYRDRARADAGAVRAALACVWNDISPTIQRALETTWADGHA
jgi:hypothetical protein